KSEGNKSKKILIFALSMVLSCLIAFGASFGAITHMISTGAIQVESTEDNDKEAVFTITKVEKEAETNENDAPPVGSISKLTNQEIAKKLIPSVVCIQNYQIVEYYNFFGGTTQKSDEVSPAGEGSGIIFSSDGYIITNAHVVSGADNLKVITSDGATYEAALIGSDEITDIAVIKIEAENLPAAEFGKAEDLNVADIVLAIGNPGGMTFNSSVTIGYVSALNREIEVGDGGYTMKCIQTDAAINPGNSGGALLNSYGQVIGINSSKIIAAEFEGMGFSIPISDAKEIVDNLIKHGRITNRAKLGISYYTAASSEKYSMVIQLKDLPAGSLIIGRINADSDLATKDIMVNDIITKVNGKELTTSSVLLEKVENGKIGDTLTLTIVRFDSNYKMKTFDVKVKLVADDGKVEKTVEESTTYEFYNPFN
ncbi:MAG: trypsin-like peptidase domain-containing protein, partial [Clostridia bacterium]|nr:trypsin-like peptidase domain-containing protein [Clostridia bacterium]